MFSIGGLNAQIIEFKDDNLKAYLIASNDVTVSTYAKDKDSNTIRVDANQDGEIDLEEALKVYRLSIFKN